MGTRLTIRVPLDYVLARDVCSYGYFGLAPNVWDVKLQALGRVLELSGGPVGLVIGQGGKAQRGRGKGIGGEPLGVVADRALLRGEQAEAKLLIGRMLRLDECAADIAAFHRVDPRWKKSGHGRVFRSPTLFEDVIKTVTSCNVTWPSTVNMNRRLCEVCGKKVSGALGVAGLTHSFPTAKKLARTRETTLRGRCRVGYRDGRIVQLGKLFAGGAVDEAWLEDSGTSDDDVRTFLIGLPGIGPYAAANIMQLLGRYSHLPLDTEGLRHGKEVLGLQGTDRAIMKRVHEHFGAFGDHAFRSYWFEMWTRYEAKNGPAWEWERETVKELT